MAFPFGGHPTLEQYLEWLRSEGFQYKTGYIVNPTSGKSLTVIQIENSEGEPLLPIPDIEMNERLAPSTVERFDERLGVKSPFASKPH